MIYAFNKKIGLTPCENREEAIQMMNNERITEDTRVELKHDKNGIRPYLEYKRQYEAVLLYIVKKANEEYPNYLTVARLGKIFTMTMLRWYIRVKGSYTGEKPIKAGRIPRYHNTVGFPAFDDEGYYDNIRRVLHFKKIRDDDKNKEWTVMWTEIETSTLKSLIANNKMVDIIDGAVRDCKYPSLERTINQLFKKLPAQYKMKKEVEQNVY